MIAMKDEMIDEQINSNKEIYKQLTDEKSVTLAYKRQIIGLEAKLESVETKAANRAKIVE